MIKTTPFIDYLKTQQHLRPSTIQRHLQNMNYFVAWAIQRRLTSIDYVTYLELLDYVQEQKQKGLQVQTIKLRLNSLSKYYEYLKHIAILDKNPTRKIKLKGHLKSITQNLLHYSELEHLYTHYLKLDTNSSHLPLSPYTKQKNNVLAGLLIWQGAISSELQKMTLEHLNLQEGTIHLPKQARGAARELKLLPKQVLQLYQYIHEARPKLLKKQDATPSPSVRFGERLGSSGLFPGNLHNQCTAILHQFKGLNQNIHNLSQIRASIIIHWIKVHGKRQAQYMAGHKHILSTERFEQQDMQSLSEALSKHHPFG